MIHPREAEKRPGGAPARCASIGGRPPQDERPLGDARSRKDARPPRDGRPPRDERLPKDERLLARGDFVRVQSRGTRFHTESFIVFALPSSRPRTRFGVTVSRKVGKAVVRNRIKRLVREVVRRGKRHVPRPLDVVFVAKKQATGVSYPAVEREFESFCERAAAGGRRRERRGPR